MIVLTFDSEEFVEDCLRSLGCAYSRWREAADDVSLGEHRVRADSASQMDVLRTRLFGVKAVMAAARRRRTLLHLRVLLVTY